MLLLTFYIDQNNHRQIPELFLYLTDNRERNELQNELERLTDERLRKSGTSINAKLNDENQFTEDDYEYDS
jgi:hypothetical protein